jgi:hypothetical protein
MFLAASDCKAVESAIDSLPFKKGRDIVANNASGKTERIRSEAGMISLVNPQIGNVKRSLPFPDEPVMDGPGIGSDLEVGEWVGEIGGVPKPKVVLYKTEAGAFFQADNVTRMNHE